MFGHFGFSYIGLLFLLMLFIPNIYWAKHQPKHYSPSNENKCLLLFERIGQVLVSSCALIFSDYNIHTPTIWTLWLLAAILCMVMYECWWIRYFRSKQTLQDFYRSYLGIPVAGATLPILAFFLLGIYGKVIWLLLSTLILGIGHIGIHLQHRKELL